MDSKTKAKADALRNMISTSREAMSEARRVANMSLPTSQSEQFNLLLYFWRLGYDTAAKDMY